MSPDPQNSASVDIEKLLLDFQNSPGIKALDATLRNELIQQIQAKVPNVVVEMRAILDDEQKNLAMFDKIAEQVVAETLNRILSSETLKRMHAREDVEHEQELKAAEAMITPYS